MYIVTKEILNLANEMTQTSILSQRNEIKLHKHLTCKPEFQQSFMIYAMT